MRVHYRRCLVTRFSLIAPVPYGPWLSGTSRDGGCPSDISRLVVVTERRSERLMYFQLKGV
jgi:hypothetical protein